MIVVELKGGLGNQMFQYSCGRALSLSLNVPLGLDCSFFSIDPVGRKCELYHYPIEAEFLSLRESSRLIYKSGWRLRAKLNRFLGIHLPIYRDTYFNEERSGIYDPRVIGLPDGTCLGGYWQSEKYFSRYRKQLLSEFQLKSEINPVASEVGRKILSVEGAVSLHFRRGDYVASPATKKIHDVCSMAYYERAVSEIVRRIGTANLFIFSDDPEWSRQNSCFDVPITIIPSGNKGFEDLYLMSLCDHHIIANSSFSWWGAWLNQKPNKLVIAPSDWFADASYLAVDIVPEEWTRIQV